MQHLLVGRLKLLSSRLLRSLSTASERWIKFTRSPTKPPTWARNSCSSPKHLSPRTREGLILEPWLVRERKKVARTFADTGRAAWMFPVPRLTNLAGRRDATTSIWSSESSSGIVAPSTVRYCSSRRTAVFSANTARSCPLVPSVWCGALATVPPCRYLKRLSEGLAL